MRLRLKELREDNDIFQKEIADYLNIKQQTYSRYELGIGNPPLPVMEALAKYYNTSVDYLMGLTNEKKPYPRV